MERAVRRPVPAIRTGACGESTAGSGKYQPGGHAGAGSCNPTAVPHSQGSRDQHTHCAGSGVPRALGLRTASVPSSNCIKESHTGTHGDPYNPSDETDICWKEDTHADHSHCNCTGNASERLGPFNANAPATRVDGSRSLDG